MLRWQEYHFRDIPEPWPGRSAQASRLLTGKIRQEFLIIEFEIRNKQRNPIIISKTELDEWMFSDHHIPPMYGAKRDYRVYDIPTQKRLSMGHAVKLGPDDVIGRRVEIIEKTDGPGWVSSHSRYSVPGRNHIELKIWAGSRIVRKSVKIPGSSVHDFTTYGNWPPISRWSGDELISAPVYTISGAPRP